MAMSCNFITALHLITFVLACNCVLSHSLSHTTAVEVDQLQPPFRALYVFGGSTVDAGNNNYIDTVAKVNYPPYGVDFEGGKATGRATNGKSVVDIIAEKARLPFPPPDRALLKQQIPITGVNYAAGSSGILPILPLHPTLKPIFRKVLSLDEQIKSFKKTTKSLKAQFGSLGIFTSHMSKSLFFIHTGTNDLGIGWERGYSVNFDKNFEEYAVFLSDEFSRRLEAIYKLGARRFVVNNIAPLGCLPSYIHSRRHNSSCVDEVNERVDFFNGLLPEMLSKLEKSLNGSTFVLFDLYRLFEDINFQPQVHGFTNLNGSCCIDVAGNQTRECLLGSIPCADRSSYVFFDSFHPTESVHKLWAGRVMRLLSL